MYKQISIYDSAIIIFVYEFVKEIYNNNNL